MKIAYGSDLHLDNYYSAFTNSFRYPPIETKGADVLLLAGDIYEYKYYARHIDYIKFIATKFKHVIIIEGNHEFYHSDVTIAKPDYPSNVHLLRNESIIINDIVFYGGPLWNNCSELDNEVKSKISSLISDFYIIENGCELINFTYMQQQYDSFLEGLYETLLTKENMPLVVMSHFAPSLKSVNERFKGSLINPYFCNDMDSIIKNMNIKYWIHGHTHDPVDYMIENINVLCNPRGYPSEDGSREFDFKLIGV